MDHLLNLSRLIKFHRKQSHLSQSGLAELAGVGKTVIYDIEKGKMTVQLDTLTKVLHALNIKIIFESPLMPSFEESSETSMARNIGMPASCKPCSVTANGDVSKMPSSAL